MRKSANQRLARFRCAVAVAHSGRLLWVAEESCQGTIALSMRGTSGFGYDPVFIPRGYKKTFSQLGPKIKDRLSHRSKALKKAKKFIQKYL